MGLKTIESEREPLLTQPGQVAVAADEAANEAGQPIVPVHNWHGGLLQCCGSCDLVGWGSCLLARNLPCVAFGSNMKRGLRQSAWLHGMIYLTLFLLASWLALAALGAANHNVLATCNGPLPHPHPHHGPPHHDLPEPKPLPRELSAEQEDLDNPVLKRDEDDEDDWHVWHIGKHEDDGNDGDHKHDDEEHKGKGKGKHGDKKKGKKGCKGKKGKDKKAPELELDAESVTMEASGTFDVRKALQEPKDPRDPRPHPPHPPKERFGSPECQKAVGLYVGAWALLIFTGLAAVHYAAKRRTLLRMKFGIAGSKLSDFCTWFWCGPCALCQETRTLWVNNVHEGVWHGPTKYAPIPTMPEAPTTQFMTPSQIHEPQQV